MPNPNKKIINEKIAYLSREEHMEIFKIILDHEIPFSQNNNGIFLDMGSLSDDIVVKIEHFIDFCFKNRKDFEEYEKKITEITKETLENKNAAIEETPHATGITQMNEKLHPIKNDWIDVLKDNKKNEKVQRLISHMNEKIDNIHKKKGNMKYTNAKKRFARKVISDKKSGEHELSNMLSPEEYVL